MNICSDHPAVCNVIRYKSLAVKPVSQETFVTYYVTKLSSSTGRIRVVCHVLRDKAEGAIRRWSPDIPGNTA